MSRGKLTRIAVWLVVVAAVGITGGFLLRYEAARTLAENEREAAAALKLLTVAEVDFRSNDRDDNQINDFWVGDVAGLYEFKLIPRELAEADAAPLKPLVPQPVPYKGYFFRAMVTDENDQPYREGASPHNTSKFAFTAFPARYEETGRNTFIVNEGNTILKRDRKGEPFLKFPTEDEWEPPSSLPPAAATAVRTVTDAGAQLKETTVTAHLMEKHVAGRSLLWCVSFQLAWDEFCDHTGYPAVADGAVDMCHALNRRLVGKSALKEGTYLARAGFFKNGIIPSLRKEMSERFPSATVPLPSERDLPPGESNHGIAFAYLFRICPSITRSIASRSSRSRGGRSPHSDCVTTEPENRVTRS